jgi:hypothetical protein
MLDHIPELISFSLAAQLAGFSYKTFIAQFIDTGRVGLCNCLWDPPRGRQAVWRESLEGALDRRFTLEELRAADAGLRKKREWMKRYRRRHAAI